MPKMLARVFGGSFQTELYIMWLMEVGRSIMFWKPFNLKVRLKELDTSINSIGLSAGYTLFIKIFLSAIARVEFLCHVIVPITLLMKLYPIITLSRPKLLLPWLFIHAFKPMFLVIAVVMALTMYSAGIISTAYLAEVLVVENINILNAVIAWYNWFLCYTLYADLGKIELSTTTATSQCIRKLDVFSSVPNIHEILYGTKYSFGDSTDGSCSDRAPRLLRTLSFDVSTDDASLETASSSFSATPTIVNESLTPGEKSRILLKVTKDDIARARSRLGKAQDLIDDKIQMDETIATTKNKKNREIISDYESDREPTNYEGFGCSCSEDTDDTAGRACDCSTSTTDTDEGAKEESTFLTTDRDKSNRSLAAAFEVRQMRPRLNFQSDFGSLRARVIATDDTNNRELSEQSWNDWVWTNLEYFKSSMRSLFDDFNDAASTYQLIPRLNNAIANSLQVQVEDRGQPFDPSADSKPKKSRYDSKLRYCRDNSQDPASKIFQDRITRAFRPSLKSAKIENKGCRRPMDRSLYSDENKVENVESNNENVQVQNDELVTEQNVKVEIANAGSEVIEQAIAAAQTNLQDEKDTIRLDFLKKPLEPTEEPTQSCKLSIRELIDRIDWTTRSLVLDRSINPKEEVESPIVSASVATRAENATEDNNYVQVSTDDETLTQLRNAFSFDDQPIRAGFDPSSLATREAYPVFPTNCSVTIGEFIKGSDWQKSVRIAGAYEELYPHHDDDFLLYIELDAGVAPLGTNVSTIETSKSADDDDDFWRRSWANEAFNENVREAILKVITDYRSVERNMDVTRNNSWTEDIVVPGSTRRDDPTETRLRESSSSIGSSDDDAAGSAAIIHDAIRATKSQKDGLERFREYLDSEREVIANRMNDWLKDHSEESLNLYSEDYSLKQEKLPVSVEGSDMEEFQEQ